MNHPTSDTDWITLTQAATRLGVHPATLRRWADDGEVPALLTPGGHRRFRSMDIDRFAAQRAPAAAAGVRSPTPEDRLMVTCFGTNHRCAPTEFREHMMRLALELDAEQHASSGDAGDTTTPDELVVLATCNRTELYTVGGEPGAGVWLDRFAAELARRHQLTVRQLNERCYRLDDLDVVHHLFRVTCGLDSMVVGESEIAGQVAAACERASQHRAIGPVLTEIFQSAVQTARRARSETAIGRGSASVSSVAVGLGRERLGDLQGRNVLVVGSGKMGRLAADAFRGLGGARLTIANRTREHAARVVSGSERAIGLDDIGAALVDTDLVLTSTSSPNTIIDRAMVEDAMRHRQSDRPLVIVDIAVPRDVDDAVRHVDNVHLFGMDDLRDRIDANLAERQAEIPRVDRIIDEEIEAFNARQTEAHVRPIISALRHQAEGIRRREVERFMAKRAPGSAGSPEDIEQLTQSIVNKLLHNPTAQLRLNADTFRREEYERMVRRLFALD